MGIGLYLIYKLIKDADSESIFDGFILYGLGFVYLAIFIFNTLLDRKEYIITKLKSSYLSTFIGILFFVTFFITQLTLDARDSSELILQANNDGGFNGCGFEFRADGTYKFFNGSGLGVDYFRGKYTIKDSIITLDKNKIDNVIVTNRLVIREFKHYDNPDGPLQKVIYQIGSNNEIMYKDLDFVVNVDKRAK